MSVDDPPWPSRDNILSDVHSSSSSIKVSVKKLPHSACKTFHLRRENTNVPAQLFVVGSGWLIVQIFSAISNQKS